MYSKIKPLFPKLHKCGWCRKRLNKEMPIVAKEIIWGDGVSIDCYFCSEKCARAELKYRREEQEDREELNRRIFL